MSSATASSSAVTSCGTSEGMIQESPAESSFDHVAELELDPSGDEVSDLLVRMGVHRDDAAFGDLDLVDRCALAGVEGASGDAGEHLDWRYVVVGLQSSV